MGNPRTVGNKLSEAGFSLIELLIVVSIILIITAIAIPNFLHAKMAANESAAVSALRTLASEEVNYGTAYGGGYSPSLAAMGPPTGGGQVSSTSADMVDQILASGIRGGYQFMYTPVNSGGGITGYQVNANPLSPGITGEWYFYADESNVIRENYGSAASVGSSVIPR